MDYIPNVFENYLENSNPEVRLIPPPRWFVAYYRNGRGNFIHASRYLAKEIDTIPEGNLKKYVQKVTKMRNSSNIVLFTFFGSTLPDRVHIDPINLRVRFRQYLRYRLEQDILQLSNSQSVRLGSPRRELLYRQKDGTGATSYASLVARSSAESAGPKATPSPTSRLVGAGGPFYLANRFAFLSDDSVDSSPLKGLTKRHRGSAESLDLALPKQSKVSTGEHDPALQTIPRMSGRITKRPVPLWNAACTNAVREKRAAISRLRRHRGDPQCLEVFRCWRARARRVLKEAQRASWKAYVSSINARTPLTDVFNKVRRMARKYSVPSPPVLLSAGETVADPKSDADLFAEHFASVSWKNPAAPGARYHQRMESLGIIFSYTGGESYNFP
ncbi:hypothetical protein E2C01_053969 [Portunus trituberculatus]|uniref:Uncharacterized protein n=1 Tax=Portunus trituberculatus TaxID=210409 RepID=A0A5B7GRX0_PORTR|nr:hypothetical protein [Portunus trituberculatus]